MDNYIGEIRLFAGTFAPSGWALCDGSLLSIANNTGLFTLIGTTYGGDGQNTFGLPDLRGRVPVGQGQGTGLSPRVVGQSAGEEAHTLVIAEMPSHTHPATAVNGTASTGTPGSSVIYGTVTANGNTLSLYTTLTTTTGVQHQMGTNAVGPAGGSLPHDNTMPTLTINYIIALSGIFPTQN